MHGETNHGLAIKLLMDSYELAAFQSGLPIVQIDPRGRSIGKKF
jgi:hypothetical protein